jgi:bacterioferritin-associated ferredoxin
MSGRRASARLAGATERASAALAPLPHAVAVRILASLPPETRLRCAAVCRGWRATLADASIWTRLDLSPARDVGRYRIFNPCCDAQFSRVAARAQGGLEALDVSECARISDAALHAAVAANAATLRELRACSGLFSRKALKTATLKALLQAAPALRELRAHVTCDSVPDALRMLRNEPPFGPLRIDKLKVECDAASHTPDAMHELAAAVATHASLHGLSISDAPLGVLAALHALADALLAHSALRHLTLERCNLGPLCAPALARIAGGGSPLWTFRLEQAQPLLDTHAAVLLQNALRTNSTLLGLGITDSAIWANPLAAVVLVNAVADHPSLQSLSFTMSWECADNALVGAALGSLIAANAPALQHLDVTGSGLDDAALGPLIDALASNTHLRTLDLSYNEMSEALVRDRLLPALRANGSVYVALDEATPLEREVHTLMRLHTRRRMRRAA